MKLNLVGRSFGRLTVLSLYRNATPKRLWRCVCICGKGAIVSTNGLTSGKTKSCGCLRREVSKAVNTSHGETKTATYISWRGMHKRCTNHPRYIANGIKVCKRWGSYAAFKKDMGERPSDNHQIERKNNSKGYSKSNCTWATRTEQSNNRHNTVKLIYKGKVKSLADWCRTLNINYNTVKNRLRLGYSTKQSLTGKSV
jgi:hypothetical protein